MFEPMENLEFSDFADDKSMASEIGKMLDTIIKKRKMNDTADRRLIIRLLKLQKGEIFKIIKELDQGLIPTDFFFVQGNVKENEVSIKARLFVVVHYVIKILVTSVNTHLKKNLDEITVTLNSTIIESKHF